MSNTEQRQYRPFEPSDLPKIQSGQLKAALGKGPDYYPAKLVSVFVHNSSLIWVITGYKYEWVWSGSNSIVVDITPTKRYAIWNHKSQRFVNCSGHPTETGFASKAEAEVYLEGTWPGLHRKGVYIVEWEIK